MSILLLYTTAPDQETARHIARTLVGEGLAACCNLLPGVDSIYRWEGEVQEEKEILVIIKSTRERYRELHDRLQAIHPYDVPELIALPVLYGSQPYLDWVEDSVKKRG